MFLINILLYVLFIGIWFGIGYFILSFHDIRLWKRMDYDTFECWSLMNSINYVDKYNYELHPNFIKAVFDNEHAGSDVMVGAMCSLFFPVILLLQLILMTINNCYYRLDGKISSLEGLKFTKEREGSNEKDIKW